MNRKQSLLLGYAKRMEQVARLATEMQDIETKFAREFGERITEGDLSAALTGSAMATLAMAWREQAGLPQENVSSGTDDTAESVPGACPGTPHRGHTAQTKECPLAGGHPPNDILDSDEVRARIASLPDGSGTFSGYLMGSVDEGDWVTQNREACGDASVETSTTVWNADESLNRPYPHFHDGLKCFRLNCGRDGSSV